MCAKLNKQKNEVKKIIRAQTCKVIRRNFCEESRKY
uniref:Uncharacterized protein n=1 Tax=Arundo donax TaxID=35708 RepID=A0A0A8XUE1_ARUDO